MALTFFWRCEGTALDSTHDFSAGDTSATASNSPSISATAAKIGSNGILIDDVNEAYQFASASIVSATLGKVAGWFRFTTWHEGAEIFKAYNSGAASNRIQVSAAASGDIQANIRLDVGTTVTIATSSAGLSTNTWYWFEFSWDQPNNDRRLAVYDSTGSLIQQQEDTSTGYDAPSGINTFQYGPFDIVGSIGLHIDNVFIGNAYGDDFLSKRDITSYTEYEGGGAGSSHSRKIQLLGVA